MRAPRLLLRTVLTVVAVAALDFAAVRAIFSMAMTFGVGLQALINTVPVGLVLNVALLRMLSTRGRTRAFWAGLLLCGAVAMSTSAWAALTPAGSARTTAGAPNRTLHGSTMWHLWNSYFVSATNLLEALGVPTWSFMPRSLDNPGIGYITVVGLMAFLPQLAFALVGGLVTLVIVPARPAPGRSFTEPAE